MLSYYQYSIILETFHFDSNNMFPFCFLFKKMVQILHHLLPSGNKYSQKLSETYHILKHWKNMLTCRSVWGFECLVSILSFKFFIRFSLHQKMNHNYFLVSSMFCCCQLCSSWGPRSWCCTKSRSCTRCCMYQTNDGAVPHMWHMMFLDQIMVLDLINMWNFTLDTITFLTAF